MTVLRDELHFVRLVCATLGFVPLLFAAWRGRVVLVLITAATVFIGILSASAGTLAQDAFERARFVDALNAAAAVIFTLGCTISVNIHTSLVGAFRILWLVTLVTSSAGYVFLQDLFPDIEAIPNDVAVAATAASMAILLFVIAASKLCGHQATTDKRTFLIELVLAAGAFTLRFDDELRAILKVHLGWAAWHLSCWASVLIALYIKDHRCPFVAESETVATDFSGAEPPPSA